MMTGRNHLPRRVLRHDVLNPTISGPRWPCREAASCGGAAARSRCAAAGPATANDQIAYHLHLDLYMVTWIFRCSCWPGLPWRSASPGSSATRWPARAATRNGTAGKPGGS